jgi:hypothetical protein
MHERYTTEYEKIGRMDQEVLRKDGDGIMDIYIDISRPWLRDHTARRTRRRRAGNLSLTLNLGLHLDALLPHIIMLQLDRESECEECLGHCRQERLRRVV